MTTVPNKPPSWSEKSENISTKMWTKVIISIFILVIKSNHIDVSAFLIAYFIKIDKFHWYSANRKIQFQVKKLCIWKTSPIIYAFSIAYLTYHFRSLRTKSTVQSNFNFPNYQPFCLYYYLTIFKPVSYNYVISKVQLIQFQKTSWGHLTNCYSQTKNQLNQPYYHISYINRTIDKKSLIQNLQYF